MVHKPTLYQVLRRAGLIHTKKDALALVKSGRVTVNGRVVPRLDFQLNPKKEEILFDGMQLQLKVPQCYFMLNKPAGYLTSTKEIDGKKSVMGLFHENPERINSLYPVGRLDYNTSGLLIITNDGKFSKYLTQPKHNVEKEYEVEIDGLLKSTDVQRIQQGFLITINHKPYWTLPAKVTSQKYEKDRTFFTLVLREGKKRQIREMVAALGHKVTSLKRIRIGKLWLGNLPEGEYRAIKKEDVI